MPTRPVHQGWRGDPGDHFERVVLLLLQILVEQEAVGFAGAAHIDAQAGVAVAGEVGVDDGVAVGGAVALAVGQVFEDRRHRVGLGVVRQPDAGWKRGTFGASAGRRRRSCGGGRWF